MDTRAGDLFDDSRAIVVGKAMCAGDAALDCAGMAKERRDECPDEIAGVLDDVGFDTERRWWISITRGLETTWNDTSFASSSEARLLACD